MRKFIDLADRVYNDRIGAYQDETNAVLEWLDSHPDQVPGRTITEREYNNAVIEADTFAERLNLLGFTVAAADASELARALDEDGVKAPDHD